MIYVLLILYVYLRGNIVDSTIFYEDVELNITHFLENE